MGGKMEILHHDLKNALIILLPKYINFSRALALKLWVDVQEQVPELWPVCLLLISHFPETLLVCKQQSTEVELWCTVLDINIFIKLSSILLIFNHNPKC
jgi:hypothetical protein